MSLEPQQTQAWIHSSPFFMPSDLFGGSSGDPDGFNYEGFPIDSSHVYYDPTHPHLRGMGAAHGARR